MQEVVIVDAIRTRSARLAGTLSTIRRMIWPQK
jgi:hypothetical protein